VVFLNVGLGAASLAWRSFIDGCVHNLLEIMHGESRDLVVNVGASVSGGANR
jgi:hypothetical protein